jgi:iron complex transport system ATP-binding protein
MNFEARELRVRYGRAPKRALDGVSLSVPTGALYAVLGPNGSGKSTLMRALMGLVPVESGEALIGGRSAGGWDRRELAKVVGAVPQMEHMAFPLRVDSFVGMGRYPHLGPLRPPGEEDRVAVEGALDRCDVTELASRDVMSLSGGELQRVRIARSLAQDPTALVLDEPTASLDIRHEMSIFQLLRSSANRGMTVLLITHNLNLAARFADRLLLLDGGRVASEGRVEDVFQEEILQQVYGWPVSVREDPSTGAPQLTPLEGPPLGSGARGRVEDPPGG